jgi:hypothetical protein
LRSTRLPSLKVASARQIPGFPFSIQKLLNTLSPQFAAAPSFIEAICASLRRRKGAHDKLDLHRGRARVSGAEPLGTSRAVPGSRNMRNLLPEPEQVLVKCPQCGAWPMSLARRTKWHPLASSPSGARSAGVSRSTGSAWRGISFRPQRVAEGEKAAESALRHRTQCVRCAHAARWATGVSSGWPFGTKAGYLVLPGESTNGGVRCLREESRPARCCWR